MINGATTRFVYDGDALVAELNGNNGVLRRYIHGSNVDSPLVWLEGGGTGDRRFYHADHQGSIIALSDSNGGVLHTTSYSPYGVPDGLMPGRFAYTGQAVLPGLDLYHYKARVYSPTLGRFLQTDPIGYEDQQNLYAYVGNDPMNWTDPSGMETVTSCGDYEGSGACTETSSSGNTFNEFDNAAMNAAMDVTDLSETDGNEWSIAIEANEDGTFTLSVAVSEGSPRTTGKAGKDLLAQTDNPAGDVHPHPTQTIPFPRDYSVDDVDKADGLSSQNGRTFTSVWVDNPTGRVIAYEGAVGSYSQNSDGSWQRTPNSSLVGTARVIGNVGARSPFLRRRPTP